MILLKAFNIATPRVDEFFYFLNCTIFSSLVVPVVHRVWWHKLKIKHVFFSGRKRYQQVLKCKSWAAFGHQKFCLLLCVLQWWRCLGCDKVLINFKCMILTSFRWEYYHIGVFFLLEGDAVIRHLPSTFVISDLVTCSCVIFFCLYIWNL